MKVAPRDWDSQRNPNPIFCQFDRQFVPPPRPEERFRSPRIPAVFVAGLLLLGATASAEQVQVMTSGAFTAACVQLAPDFERRTSIKVETTFGASMGNTPEAIPNRMERGEPVDVVILARPALDELIKKGKVIPDSRVDLVRSSIGAVVRKGAPKPDISSVDALRRTLLDASSISYSDSASGVYISTELFRRLGIEDRVRAKSKKIEGEPVGAVVARGESHIGFQQISELLPVQGVDYLGPLPPEVQRVTVFSAGIAVGAKHPDAARKLIEFFTSSAAAPTIERTGLEPIKPAERQ